MFMNITTPANVRRDAFRARGSFPPAQLSASPRASLRSLPLPGYLSATAHSVAFSFVLRHEFRLR